ncbi:MAG: PPK2 family polyphosphate kinase [Fimbriimonadales bacterium]
MTNLEPVTGHVDLGKLPTKVDGGIEKAQGEQRTQELGKELAELLDLLYYAGKRGLLIVLQGRDTAGKDGTIRTLLSFANVQSCRVAPFKVPTEKELAHDFLWRCHLQTPEKGETVVFNRSHYEDVLVVRVHELAPEQVWKRRYGHINAFEQLLVDSGTIVLKFFLHISKDEQKERLLAREQEVEKSWKLSAGDWKEREFWDAYTVAYEDAISKCSTEDAPWYVVPADHKWYRDLVVTQTIVDHLKAYKDEWLADLEELGKERKVELAAYRASVEK